MNQNIITVRCKNNGKTKSMEAGCNLQEVLDTLKPKGLQDVVNAKVNNVVRGLDFVLYNSCDVEFQDITSESGMRTYSRSLCFVLSKATKDLFPKSLIRVETSVSGGYYCRILIGRPLEDADVTAITKQMQKIIDRNLPFVHKTALTDDAIKFFEKEKMQSKVKLLRSYNRLYTDYYTLEGEADFYYGSLLPTTGKLNLFGLMRYSDGVLLRLPDDDNPKQLRPLVKQEKMLEVIKEHRKWQEIIGISNIGELNEVNEDKVAASALINVAEALQEKKISRIAESIQSHPEVKLVLVAGPSSSGKTTFSKRLSVQLMACGIKPVAISMDDYFIDRDKTPKDENGDYDYESVYALNIPQMQKDLQDLFDGKEIKLPKYDFTTGRNVPSGKSLKIDSHTVIVMEGIHGLNPVLTKEISDLLKFKIYVSALTTISLDYHNYIPTTDNRLLRRIVRDYKYRKYSAQETISRWPKVVAGERKWIYPYQEEADVMFNSALLFELAGLRNQAMPLLKMVPENTPEYAEAYRLRKFLKYILPIKTDGLPPTSLLREFLGGSTFHY